MWLRVSIGLHGDNLEKIKDTYDAMSLKYFTHATPTLFNSGTPHPQLSSCFLLAMENDSISGIYNTLKDCAMISKWAGGIGLHIHNIRASGSHIRGTNGQSNGIVPMLKVFNNTAKYVDQCVVPETLIYTTEGPKQIQHCSFGETSIFNLTGKTEKIENVLEHDYEGEIMEIETFHSLNPLKITPEHPIYVLKNNKKGLNYNVIKNRLDKKICQFEWVDAKEITTDDMVVYSIPHYESDFYNISDADCYVYGVILGDGSISEKTIHSGKITLHTETKNHIKDFLIDYPIYDIELVFVELPKFHKEVNGLETLSEKWLYFLKYARQLDVVPESMNLVPEIKQAFEMANEMNLTPEQVAQFTSEEFVNAVESVFCHS
jgi:hypothetical protein